MKRPLAFRTKVIRSAMGTLDAEDRAVLTAVLNEIDHGDLKTETHKSLHSGTVIQWDICSLSVFNEGICIKHWTRTLEGETSTTNIHAVTRRLSPPVSSVTGIKQLCEQLRCIVTYSIFGTIAFLAIGRTHDDRHVESLWWHPSMLKEDASFMLHAFVEYALEEKS